MPATVPRPAREVSPDWLSLRTGAPDVAQFDPSLVTSLPEVAQRALTHAIEPGTPLWQSVEFSMRGRIRMGKWHPFTARQVLAPGRGFVWAARARVFGLPLTGFDRYSSSSGQMRWKLFGLVPVMTASDPDVSRSAAGRLAAEGVLVPTAFQAARWSDSGNPDSVFATWTVESNEDTVEVHVAGNGAVRQVTMQRWREGGRVPFIVTFADERTFSGVTIPTRVRASWQSDEYFEAEISNAVYR